MGPWVTKDSKRRAGLPQVPHARLSSCFGIPCALDGEDPIVGMVPERIERCWDSVACGKSRESEDF